MIRLASFSVFGSWLGAAVACLGAADGRVIDVTAALEAFFAGGGAGCTCAALLNSLVR